MEIRLTTDISGLRDGVPWPKRGDTIDLPDDEAVELLGRRQAEAVEQAAPETAALTK